MSTVQMEDHINRNGLRIGVALPFLYSGTQHIAAPFHPDYSFLTMNASTLGSDRSTMPWLFNAGLLLTGLAAFVDSFGFLVSLKDLRTH